MTFIKHGSPEPIEILRKTSEEDEDAREKLEKLKEEAGKQMSEQKKEQN